MALLTLRELKPTRSAPYRFMETKLLAEEAVAGLDHHWIFRVSVLFRTRQGQLRRQRTPASAPGTPIYRCFRPAVQATYTLDAASKILEVMESRRYGLFHLCNQGACTRLELSRQVAMLANLPAENIVGKPMAEMKEKHPGLNIRLWR